MHLSQSPTDSSQFDATDYLLLSQPQRVSYDASADALFTAGEWSETNLRYVEKYLDEKVPCIWTELLKEETRKEKAEREAKEKDRLDNDEDQNVQASEQARLNEDEELLEAFDDDEDEPTAVILLEDEDAEPIATDEDLSLIHI